MMLVEEKKISLDDPVNQFLPSPPGKWKDITVHYFFNSLGYYDTLFSS
jgi:CubicO group peptidase (beta-lactamase class C family)